MKPNLFNAVVALIMTVATSALAEESPTPAAALGRPSLQSPKAPRMAILTVALAGKRMLAAGERGIVIYSDDNGNNWTQAQTPTSASLTAMRFANDQQGWAVGHMGIVLHTADGGLTWSKQLDGIEAARLTLDVARKNGDERAIRDAERLVQDGADKPFFDLCVINEHTLFIVGAYNLALRSDDSGKTWTAWQKHIANPRALHLYAIRAVGSTLFIAGEQGLLLRSSDSGQSFAPINTPYKGSWFGLVAERSNGLLAYGLRGNVYLTKDMGKTWKQANSATPVSISAGTELADGRIVLVSQGGDVLVSTNQGLSFTPLPEKTGLPLAAVAEGRDGLVLGSLRGVRPVSLPATN